jgi:dihydrolipoamide dehydrogenase
VTFDLIVVGSGPAGYAAAFEGASLGASVAVAERGELGGTCLNRGCIPTKMLLGATQPMEDLAAQARVKTLSGEMTVHLDALQTRKERLVAATRKAMRQRLKDAGVTLLTGEASFTGLGALRVHSPLDQTDVSFSKAIIATGAKPALFPGMEVDHERVLNSEDFLEIKEAPTSLIVVGAGVIGLEMAQIAHRLGTRRLVLVDAMDRIAPVEDPEVSTALLSVFKRRKWRFKLSARVSSLRSEGDGVRLELASGEVLEADRALVAVGRKPVTEGLALEAAGLAVDARGVLPVDQCLRVSENFYAVGDVNGMMQLAHAASHQACYAVRHALGKETGAYASGPTPSILYGDPEVMRVGALVAELKAAGDAPETSRAPLVSNPMAQAHASTQGFVKIVWRDGRVAGVTAVGADVSRFTVAASMMVQERWRREDAESMMFPHPTLDEALKEALLAERAAG